MRGLRPYVLPPLPDIDTFGASEMSSDLIGWMSEIAFRQSELQKAETVATEMDRFLDWLEPQRGPKAGVEVEVCDAIRGTVLGLRDRLAAGEYLSKQDLYAWVTLLASFGVRRLTSSEYRRPLGGFGDPIQQTVAINHIKEYPHGHFWDAVVIFDERIIEFLFSEAAQAGAINSGS